jgi:hypothetical protein
MQVGSTAGVAGRFSATVDKPLLVETEALARLVLVLVLVVMKQSLIWN